MKYDLSIREHNVLPHIDIEKDIQGREGQFTFTLRVNNGNIVDYNVTEFVDIRKYFQLKQVVMEEFTLSHHFGRGSQANPLWPNNIQHGDTKRSS